MPHVCLQAERLQRSGRVGNGWRRRKECAVQALNFLHPPSTQSWPSPVIPLLAFSVCTAGFEACSCSTHIQNKYYPYPSSPGIPGVQDQQLAARASNPARCRSHPEKHGLEKTHPSPGQAPGHWEWGLEGAFRQAKEPERGFSLQGGAARCDRAAFVQLIPLPSLISERRPGAETDQVCFY